MSRDTANATPSRETISSVSTCTRLIASIVEHPFRKLHCLSCQSGTRPDMCLRRRAATTLSRSLPISSSRQSGRYADGEVAGRPSLRSRTSLTVRHAHRLHLSGVCCRGAEVWKPRPLLLPSRPGPGSHPGPTPRCGRSFSWLLPTAPPW